MRCVGIFTLRNDALARQLTDTQCCTSVRTDLQSSPRCSRSRCSSRRITVKTQPGSPTSASRASSPTLRCALLFPHLLSAALDTNPHGLLAARPDHHRLRGASQPCRSRQNRWHRLPGRVRYRRERLRSQVIPIQPFLACTCFVCCLLYHFLGDSFFKNVILIIQS